MRELSFPCFWNHGVHKQLLSVLFHTYSVHADALTEMQFGSLNALITPNCIIPVGESRLVSAPLFDLEMLVDYELLEMRIVRGDFLQPSTAAPSELCVLHSLCTYIASISNWFNLPGC